MNGDFLKKAWKDPVLSKIISVWLLALLTVIYNVLISLISKHSFRQEFVLFWTQKIDLWIIVTAIILIFCILYLINRKFIYDDDTLILDRKLFDSIRYQPLLTDFFLEVKSNGFSDRAVEMDKINAMIDLKENSKLPEFEFLNPRLEKLKVDLMNDVDELDNVLSKYIFGANAIGWVAIPSEWEFNNPDRMDEAKAAISLSENKLSNTYKKFISQGRRVLKV